MSAPKPNIHIPMDYTIPTKQYASGKTPLSERVARYIDWHTFEYGAKPTYIPIHNGEYNKLMELASFTGIVLAWGTYYQMLPLGVRTLKRMEQPSCQ